MNDAIRIGSSNKNWLKKLMRKGESFDDFLTRVKVQLLLKGVPKDVKRNLKRIKYMGKKK